MIAPDEDEGNGSHYVGTEKLNHEALGEASGAQDSAERVSFSLLAIAAALTRIADSLPEVTDGPRTAGR